MRDTDIACPHAILLLVVPCTLALVEEDSRTYFSSEYCTSRIRFLEMVDTIHRFTFTALVRDHVDWTAGSLARVIPTSAPNRFLYAAIRSPSDAYSIGPGLKTHA